MNSEDKKYQKIEIPIEGSIGILALGDIGLNLWREKREKFEEELKTQREVEKAKDEKE